MNTDSSPTRSLSRFDIVLLLGSPALLLVGRALVVPFDDQRWNDMLTSMAASPTRNAVGWSIVLVAAAALGACGLLLARLLAHRARLAVPATAAIALGWTGVAAIASGGLFMGEMAKSADRDAMLGVLAGFNEGNGNTVFALVLAGVAGNLLLAVALALTGVLRRGTAVLLGIGAAASLVAAPGPARPVGLLAGALLLAGHVLVVRDLAEPPAADVTPRRSGAVPVDA